MWLIASAVDAPVQIKGLGITLLKGVEIDLDAVVGREKAEASAELARLIGRRTVQEISKDSTKPYGLKELPPDGAPAPVPQAPPAADKVARKFLSDYAHSHPSTVKVMRRTLENIALERKEIAEARATPLAPKEDKRLAAKDSRLAENYEKINTILTGDAADAIEIMDELGI